MKVPPGAMLFSIDIDSLCTNIDTQLGLKVVKQIFEKYPDPTRPDEALLSLLELGLTKNDFEFDSKYYLQVHGKEICSSVRQYLYGRLGTDCLSQVP